MAASAPTSIVFPPEARPVLFELRTAIPDFWSLIKPEVNFLIGIATLTGFLLGYPSHLNTIAIERLLNTLFGTLLIASGAGALNQYLEHHFDAQMRRTRRRPVASGRILPATAAWCGVLLSVIGSAWLFLAVNAIAGFLAVFTLTTYLGIYTPLKRKTSLCTAIGAIPGAMPLLIGWAAAAGSLSSTYAWILYAVLFFWQFPHFMAIAWMYRDDYAQAGYLILPTSRAFRFVTLQTCLPVAGVLTSTLAALMLSQASALEYSMMLLSEVGLLYFAALFIRSRSKPAARQLLKATIIYLPVVFLALLLGKK